MKSKRPSSGTVLWAAMIAVLLTASSSQARAMGDISKEAIGFEGRQRTYYVYVPDAASPASAPVLVLLHGSFQDGLYMARLWKDFASQEGIVLLAPNALHNDAWRIKIDSPSFINAAVTAVANKYPIDLRRIYLFGQSGGAEYALTLAMLESRYFAAVAVHGGAWRQRSEYNITVLARRRIPIKLIIGDFDEFFSMSSVLDTENVFKRAGFPIEVTIVKGQHHWYSTETAPEINAMAWTFLKANSLETAPEFVVYAQ